jgi:hypothetical protein
MGNAFGGGTELGSGWILRRFHKMPKDVPRAYHDRLCAVIVDARR